MKFKTFAYSSALIAVIAASQAMASDESIKKALSGKTIENSVGEFKLHKNGKLTGKAGKKRDIIFDGAWTIREGKWCRTFSKPEQWAGTECQALEMGDGTITITGRNGPQLYQLK